MKAAVKRILSLVVGLCIALLGVICMPIVTANAAEAKTYVKVTSAPSDWSGEYLIVYESGKVAFDGSRTTMDAVSNTKAVTITDDTITTTENIYFNIAISGTSYTIQSASGYYIGQTSNANGLKSDKSTTYENTIDLNNDKTVNLVSSGAYLRFNSASDQLRFRYYKSSSYTGQKGICLYKLQDNQGGSVEGVTQQAEVDKVTASMRLAYSYKATEKEIELLAGGTDILNRGWTGSTGGSYADWSDKTATSSAVYAGQSAGGNSSIQLRATNPSGIVTTGSGGKAAKVVVTWNSNTADGRTLQVYGKNTAYSAATDLYNSSKQGTLLGTIVKGTSTELTINGDYEYIGLRSSSGAMYLSEIQITWAGEGGTATETVLEDSSFRLQCGVDASLLAIEGATEYGIRVTAGDNEKDYTASNSNSWKVEDGMVYVVINLGDIGANNERMTTEFTVAAYVKVGDVTCVSELTKTYSVATMVKAYYEQHERTEVEHLYDYLVEKGLIKEG